MHEWTYETTSGLSSKDHDFCELIIGLDLSLRRPAMCAIGSDWECDVKRAVTVSAEFTPRASFPAKRMESICDWLKGSVLALSRGVGAHLFLFVEDYPFSNNTKSTRGLAELRGAVSVDMIRVNRGLELKPVNISSARKLLLGKVPQGKGMAKRAVFESLVSLGALVENDDEADAFAVANYGMMERGWGFVGAGGE